MKPFFRWRTEEDEPWEDESLTKTAVPAPTSRLLILLIIFILVGIGFIYWQQTRQIKQEETQIQADVLAAHRTWEQAVANADFDLAVRLLSHDDPIWENAQRQLFLLGLALDRAPLGLYAEAEFGETAVTLSDNWQAAELTFEQTYTAVFSDEATPAIQLKQTYLYQLADSRWRQAPPDAEFWGGTTTYVGQWLTLRYPERDAIWAERLADDLDAELTAICAANICRTGVQARLETDPASLAALRDLLTPAINGRFHTLPTFTLVGLPVDDDAYQALYQGYTRRIVAAFSNSLDLPVPLPNQAIQSICFPSGGSRPRLFRYDLANDTWTAELSEQAFRFLTPLPDDSGLILSELPPGSAATRLTLSLWRDGAETQLFDEDGRAWRSPPLGWVGQTDPPRLVLNEFDVATQTRTIFSWLDWENCDKAGCPVSELLDFMIWAPNGRYILITSGSELSLADEVELWMQTIGPGFAPFWLDETTYGYIRYTPQMELVIAGVEDETPQILLREEDLTAVLDDPQTGTPSIAYILPHPTIPGLLFLAGPEIRGASGQYNIFAYEVATGALSLRLQLDDAPLGYPTLLTPAGVPPIAVGENGRYLLAAIRTDPLEDTWNIYLHNIQANQTQIIQARSPDYPAATAFYDWSQNGEWLVVVDDGFFKLIAPAANYERLILHDFDACYFTAWVN